MSQFPDKFMRICHAPWICNFIDLLTSWVRWFTESDLTDTYNIVPFEHIAPVNLINLRSFISTFYVD